MLDLPDTVIDEASDTPLYRQIYAHLKDQILSGAIAANARLPAEQELVERLGVSRITVKRAMNELAMSGFVRRQRGRGTVVVFNAAAPTVKGSFDTLIDGLTRMGMDTDVRLIRSETVVAEPAIAEALELDIGAPVRRIVRLRHLEGEPFSYLITSLPIDVASGFTDEELGSESLIALLERSGHAPQDAEQTITAISAPPDMATDLGIAPGAPLLRIHRIMRDGTDRPVQDITAHYRADRFQYQMRLSRAGDSGWM
ncbi:MAG: GntR family transcriptional regulator [Pseudomonadota bacterium]